MTLETRMQEAGARVRAAVEESEIPDGGAVVATRRARHVRRRALQAGAGGLCALAVIAGAVAVATDDDPEATGINVAEEPTVVGSLVLRPLNNYTADYFDRPECDDGGPAPLDCFELDLPLRIPPVESAKVVYSDAGRSWAVNLTFESDVDLGPLTGRNVASLVDGMVVNVADVNPSITGRDMQIVGIDDREDAIAITAAALGIAVDDVDVDPVEDENAAQSFDIRLVQGYPPEAAARAECGESGPRPLDCFVLSRVVGVPDVTAAKVEYDDANDSWLINVHLDPPFNFDAYVGQTVAIVVDEAVVTAATVNEGIEGDDVQVSGGFTREQAVSVAAAAQGIAAEDVVVDSGD